MSNLVQSYASSAFKVLNNAANEKQMAELIAANDSLELSLVKLANDHKTAEKKVILLRRELEDLDRPFVIHINKDQERTKRRNALAAGMAQEKDLFDLISSETERLENGRNHVEHLTAQSVGYRAEFASAVGKVLIRQLDHEEIYYSQLMDRAVVEFYTATTDGRNVKEATELIGFAHDILKDTDLGSRDNTNLNAIQDIPAAFHHIEIASMIYPPLRYKRLPVTKSSSSGFDGFFNLNAGAIKSILGHLKELKLFLEAELLSVRRRVAFAHTSLIKISERLQIIRRKLLTYNISEENGVTAPQFSDVDFDVLFPQDLHQVSNVANLNDVFASKEDVGRAMGLVYPDLLLNESVDPLDLPQYEDGMLAILSAQVTKAL